MRVCLHLCVCVRSINLCTDFSLNAWTLSGPRAEWLWKAGEAMPSSGHGSGPQVQLQESCLVGPMPGLEGKKLQPTACWQSDHSSPCHGHLPQCPWGWSDSSMAFHDLSRIISSISLFFPQPIMTYALNLTS